MDINPPHKVRCLSPLRSKLSAILCPKRSKSLIIRLNDLLPLLSLAIYNIKLIIRRTHIFNKINLNSTSKNLFEVKIK